MYQDRGLASDEWLNPYKAHLWWLPMFFWRSEPDVTMAAVTTKWTVVVQFVCTGNRDGDDGGEQSPSHGDDNRLE